MGLFWKENNPSFDRRNTVGNLHFDLKIIFHSIFIEKPCIFSKLVQLIIRTLLSKEILLEYLFLKP